jgi:histidine triad (HIT) family protein
MMSVDPACIFCRIVAGELPSTQVYSDDAVVAFRDAHAQAPTHVLIVPRRHIPTIAALDTMDAALLANLVAAANQVAREEGIAGQGYRLVVNHGANAGQTVHHLHFHLLGGRSLRWPPG